MNERVKLEWPQEGVALLTLTDTAPNHNLTCAGVSELADRLEEARKAGARVAVLASGVPGHWYEHAFLDDIRNLVSGRAASGDPAGWARSLHEVSRCNVVTIAAIAGNTSGGGCELGWGCDLRVAEQGSLFSQPEVIIGCGTGIGGTSRLMRLIGRTVTAEVVLMGQPLTAERLYALGGINRLVGKGQAVETALSMARHMAALPPVALAGMKRMLTEDEDLHLSAALDNDQTISQALFADALTVSNMESFQQRFDAGQSLENAYFAGRSDGGPIEEVQS
ncbi:MULTISPECIES: enoyl-CoA hydratase/isomerase family protein [Pseudomonas fluorescens group]|uniref:enoyl-CoA hydratase/isomerase family protein n=1 Tax=Pseudomonas fluorescens group TaxID=136843 RepID=UPI000695CABC|nr:MULTISPECIES: enoyl-CoA hydratase/isomerase family protein [Pseudomonas fluorescens group]WGT27979.1 enoyl-CoA hydratase/isomerase family protein [Pseudomonas marginalis]